MKFALIKCETHTHSCPLRSQISHSNQFTSDVQMNIIHIFCAIMKCRFSPSSLPFLPPIRVCPSQCMGHHRKNNSHTLVHFPQKNKYYHHEFHWMMSTNLAWNIFFSPVIFMEFIMCKLDQVNNLLDCASPSAPF